MLTLSCLGEVKIEHNGEPLTGLRSAKATALLIYLALNPQPHTRQTLAGLLWGDISEEQAKNNLRVTLNNLNQLLPDSFEANRLTVSFRIAQPHWIDVNAFAAVAAQAQTPLLTMDELRAAAALYRGDFLAEFVVEDAPEFEEWRRRQQQRLKVQAGAVLMKLANMEMAEKRPTAAVTALRQLLTVDPVREESYRRLMTLLARQGSYAEAVAAYQSCRKVLRAQLDTIPMPETVACYDRIRAAQAHQPLSPPTQPTEPFVGRQRELEQIIGLLANPACRLLTIVGFGGMGKTRLALQAMHALHHANIRPFLNGIAFVDLLPVFQPDALPQAMAQALALSLAGDVEPAEELLRYLHNKEMLLVLDNFEHLLDGVDYLAQLLARCPDLKLLVTCREPLQLVAEWRLDLIGLDQEGKQPARQNRSTPTSAVQLFVNAAQQVQPSFALTATNRTDLKRLCHLLAGIPLALKLAAPLLTQTSLPQLLVRIEEGLDLLVTDAPDVPPRQRSMRVIYDYTWSLLDETEQRVMAQLAIFRGGFSEEGATTVGGATPFILSILLDRGLIQVQQTKAGGRYVIHELTRQYVAGKMQAANLARLQHAHAVYFADFAQQHYQAFQAHHFGSAIEGFETEFDNVDAAWGWMLARLTAGAPQDVVTHIPQLLPMTAIYHEERSLYLPGLRRLAGMAKQLELAGWGLLTATREEQIAWAVTGCYTARLHLEVGDYAQATQLGEAILPVLAHLGLRDEYALTLLALGRSAFRTGNYAQAQSHLAQAAQHFHHSGQDLELARVLGTQALIASNQGDYQKAESIHREVLGLYQKIGYTDGIVRTLGNLGGVYNRQGRYAESRPHLQEAQTLARSRNLRSRYMFVTSNLGSATSGQGHHTQAEVLYQESLALARELGDQRWIAANLNGLARNYIQMGDPQAALAAATEGLTVATTIHSRSDTLSSLSFVGRAWAHTGRIEDALRLLLFVANHPAALETDIRFNQELLAELREELPEAVWAEAQQWGQRHTLPDLLTWQADIPKINALQKPSW